MIYLYEGPSKVKFMSDSNEHYDYSREDRFYIISQRVTTELKNKAELISSVKRFF